MHMHHYGYHKCQYVFVSISVNFSRATLKSPSSLHSGILFTIGTVPLIPMDGTVMGKERDIQNLSALVSTKKWRFGG